MSRLLTVKGLKVSFNQDGQTTEAVKGISFDVNTGETVALVGESGSGKSVTALSTVSLLGDSATVEGSIRYHETEMVGAEEADLRRVRGNDISFIFQEPMSSLNPLHTIERQIAEGLALHGDFRFPSLWSRMLFGLGRIRFVPIFILFLVLLAFAVVIRTTNTAIAFTENEQPIDWGAVWSFLFTDIIGWAFWVLPIAVGILVVQWLMRAALGPTLYSGPLRERIIGLLDDVGIRDAESRLSSYPHQLSGGQRQRVMIAMALANNPELLIADEPTTALDVTIQAQILDLLADLKRKRNMSLLFITHDLTIVRKIADRVCVMKDGEIVEHGPTAEIFANPQHPYTQLLLSAEAVGGPGPVPDGAKTVVETKNLKIWFPIHRGMLQRTVGHIKAVNDATLDIRAGETLGVVGESGSGKTTLALAIMRLIASEGQIVFLGKSLQGLPESALRPVRSDMQIVFQDPYGSLSPRMTVEQIISEGLSIHGNPEGRNTRELVAEIMAEVGIDPALMDRYPHEFSGGQRQRIAIARAMILRPKLVVLDEPTSALDMTVQVQIVELLRGLQAKYGLAYLFISHDLKVVRALSHKVMVMKQGDVVEAGSVDQIFDSPQTEYTRALMAAAFDGAAPPSAGANGGAVDAPGT